MITKKDLLGRRIFAKIIDSLVIASIASIVGVIAKKSVGFLVFILIIFESIVLEIYTIIAQSINGKTIGKQIAGIKIAANNDNINYRKIAILRSLVPILLMCAYYLSLYFNKIGNTYSDLSKIDMKDMYFWISTSGILLIFLCIWYIGNIVGMIISKRTLTDYISKTHIVEFDDCHIGNGLFWIISCAICNSIIIAVFSEF